MLVGTGRDSKPAVIGQVDDPARTVVARRNAIGKDRLVTDQRQRARSIWYLHRVAARARNKSALNLGELHEAEPFHPVLERKIFAKWNQMQLVVNRQHAAVVVED